jgi:hypothetical protein
MNIILNETKSENNVHYLYYYDSDIILNEKGEVVYEDNETAYPLFI